MGAGMNKLKTLIWLILLLSLCSQAWAAPAIVQRKNGTSASLTITSTSAGHTYVGVTDSTSSPASVQTTGGTGNTFTKYFCQHTSTPEYMCIWLVNSSNASATAMTCTTCGTMNAMWFWEWSGVNTTTPIDTVVGCGAGLAGFNLICPQTPGALLFNNGYSSEGIVSTWECSGTATGFTNTGFTGTSNGFPNGNAGEDGVLSSITTITVSPGASSGCSGSTVGFIIGLQAASGATQSCVWNIGFFDYGTEVTSGNATATADIINIGDTIVIRPWCLSSCTVTSVTVGSQTATQTSVAGNTGSTAGQPYLYYILSSTQSGLLTVTMNISGTYTDAQVSYAEFPHTANCTVAHDVDSALGSGSTGTSITSPSITPSAAGELLFNFTAVESHATAIGSPWSCLENYGPGENSSCFDGTTVNAWTYILSGASGATANNVTQLNSDPWQALLTSFSLTGSGVVRRRRAWVIQSN
jgi:hypothetical protein